MNESSIDLTKEEAIKRHRMMWHWIAFETLKQKRCIEKIEAIKHFGWNTEKMLYSCWCCAYTKGGANELSCSFCPVVWPTAEGCSSIRSIFCAWACETNYETAADLAFQIATLPERSY